MATSLSSISHALAENLRGNFIALRTKVYPWRGCVRPVQWLVPVASLHTVPCSLPLLPQLHPHWPTPRWLGAPTFLYSVSANGHLLMEPSRTTAPHLHRSPVLPWPHPHLLPFLPSLLCTYNHLTLDHWLTPLLIYCLSPPLEQKFQKGRLCLCCLPPSQGREQFSSWISAQDIPDELRTEQTGLWDGVVGCVWPCGVGG